MKLVIFFQDENFPLGSFIVFLFIELLQGFYMDDESIIDQQQNKKRKMEDSDRSEKVEISQNEKDPNIEKYKSICGAGFLAAV